MKIKWVIRVGLHSRKLLINFKLFLLELRMRRLERRMLAIKHRMIPFERLGLIADNRKENKPDCICLRR